MVEDVAVNKIAIIERCLARVRAEFRDDPARLADLTIEDSIVLNLHRACEASIDLAMHIAGRERLGVPQSSRDAFTLLSNAGWITDELAGHLCNMVGFRNIAVHEYQKLSREVLVSILRERLGDFGVLCRAAVRAR